MATRNKTFTRLSFGFAVCCLISLIVSFASDRWVVSTETQVAGFKNLGLWSACFAKFRPPSWVLMDKYYDGCWWVFDREMDELRFFLIPSWFVTTQVLVTMGLVFQLITMVIMIVNVINCFPYSRSKDTIALCLSVTAAVLHGLTGILLTVAVIVFGARADNERTWLERPDQNYLSWSFGMCVLAAFLAILAFMTVALESYRLWLKRKNSEEPDKLYTVQPPATNNVSDTRKYQLSNSQYNSQRSHSANADRFYNQSDRLDGRDSGDVYTNYVQEVDESRQLGRTNGYVPQLERRQDIRQFDNKTYGDGVDSGYTQSTSTALSTQSSKAAEVSTDYEESKKIIQPVLPEYVPKSKPDTSKKKDNDSSFEESFDSDDKLNDSDDQSQSRKKKSSSKGKKTAKSLSKSKKHENKKSKHSETKTRRKKDDTSDDENSRGRHRHSKKNASPGTKRKSSRSRERSSSRHRSHSRDLNASYSESSSDSDSASVASRSRHRHKNDKVSSKRSRSRHHSSEECIKKEKQGHSTSNTGSSKKKHRKSYADDVSESEFSSKQQSKRKGDRNKSLGEKRTKSLDYLETESLNSKHSKRMGSKSKSSYSSYYEY